MVLLIKRPLFRSWLLSSFSAHQSPLKTQRKKAHPTKPLTWRATTPRSWTWTTWPSHPGLTSWRTNGANFPKVLSVDKRKVMKRFMFRHSSQSRSLMMSSWCPLRACLLTHRYNIWVRHSKRVACQNGQGRLQVVQFVWRNKDDTLYFKTNSNSKQQNKAHVTIKFQYMLAHARFG